ncbi:MAG: hypothetical protein LBU61_03530 [Coriobacteriales bacterium]|jgi:predicted nucleotidyltransferase|nr:hypothetical protein [Coriobacteriales bacterium]
MGMLLNPKELINGVNPRIAKQIAIACRFGWERLDSIANGIKETPETTRGHLLLLQEAGYIESSDFNGIECWKCSESGLNTLPLARFGKPMTRREAEKLLQQVLERVQSYNDIEEYPYLITEVKIFGSYLTETDSLGDLDLALSIEVKDKFKKVYGWELAYFSMRGGSQTMSVIDRQMYPKNELSRFLKKGSRKVSIHLDDISEITDKWEVIYEGDPK